MCSTKSCDNFPGAHCREMSTCVLVVSCPMALLRKLLVFKQNFELRPSGSLQPNFVFF